MRISAPRRPKTRGGRLAWFAVLYVAGALVFVAVVAALRLAIPG